MGEQKGEGMSKERPHKTWGQRREEQKARAGRVKRGIAGASLLTGVGTAAILAGSQMGVEVNSPSVDQPQNLQTPRVAKEVSGSPVNEALKVQRELRTFILQKNYDQSERMSLESIQINPAELQIGVVSSYGQVVAKEGLKTRTFPSLDPRFGPEAPRKKWLQYGQKIPYLTVDIPTEGGKVEHWGAFEDVRYESEQGGATWWLFFPAQSGEEVFVKPVPPSTD